MHDCPLCSVCDGRLRHVIGDDQLGAVGRGGVAAVKINVIRAVVTVVRIKEAQAELGNTQLVDGPEIGGCQVEGMPVIGGSF